MIKGPASENDDWKLAADSYADNHLSPYNSCTLNETAIYVYRVHIAGEIDCLEGGLF